MVLAVRYADDPPDGRFLVKVVYGTSKLKTDTRPFDFTIMNYAQRLICRLPQATRFDLDKVVWLPWAEEYFRARPGDSTPVISVLPQPLQQEFAWHMNARDKMGLNGHLKSC